MNTITLTRRYFFWYTIGGNVCGLISGAALMWLYYLLKAIGVNT